MLLAHWLRRAGLAHRLNRRQQQRDQHADNRDHNQQLDERKTTWGSRSAEPRRTLSRKARGPHIGEGPGGNVLPSAD